MIEQKLQHYLLKNHSKKDEASEEMDIKKATKRLQIHRFSQV